ncbi:MAG: hypothetical protein JOZ69_00585, partial [Myxococcales bacterium]|nr:hypothetical protein [Myxococcales bacterium]
MVIRAIWRCAVALLALVIVLCAVPGRARAAASAAHVAGRVALSLPGGGSGPL